MSQRRYRELRKIETNYPDAIEEVMDCRGDIMDLQREPMCGSWCIFVGGLIFGLAGGIHARK